VAACGGAITDDKENIAQEGSEKLCMQYSCGGERMMLNAMKVIRFKFTLPCAIKGNNATINACIACVITVPAINRHMATFANSLDPLILWR
jgi:UDP-N-acetylglucosamine transferase subunit ALG13